MRKCIEMEGLRFGRLTVIGRAENVSSRQAYWNCICDCGNMTVVNGCSLRSGQTKSCGCLWKEKIIEGSIKHNKKQNDFSVEGDIVFVNLSCSDKTMMVDLDVWDSWAKNYLWRESKDGYAYTAHRKYGRTFFHRKAFPDCPDGMVRDHIDGNRLNNTRKNIRFVTPSQNMFNRGISEINTSGYNGVYFHKDTGKWAAEIRANRKRIHLGLFSEKEDAIAARKQAEIELFGKYRRNE